MNNIIACNASETEIVDNLLGKSIPTYRQAYSDRTSWLMACFSELAYLKFNPLFINDKQNKLATKYIEKFAKKTNRSSLLSLLDIVAYDDKAELKKLKAELVSLKTELVKTFDTNGTQAILISTDKHITLAFRGTESTSLKDIKTDMKATKTKCDSGGYIHSGFKQAFEEVQKEIEKELKKPAYEDKPLFVTGHSLGGALATIAAKKITHTGGMASCYTFGSPRVGDVEWISDIKTPVYRVVNAADVVTIMPPGTLFIEGACWLLGLIPIVGKPIGNFLLKLVGGYMHVGDMRYLTNYISGNYNSVKLLYSVSLIYRIKKLFLFPTFYTKLFADHSITIYRKKLGIVATNRN